MCYELNKLSIYPKQLTYNTLVFRESLMVLKAILNDKFNSSNFELIITTLYFL